MNVYVYLLHECINFMNVPHKMNFMNVVNEVKVCALLYVQQRKECL
jgi:hypothetical protein